MLKKKLVLWNTTIMLGLGSSFAIPAIAANATSLQSEQTDLSIQRSSVQSQISDAEIKIIEAQEKLAELNAQIKRVDTAISENTKLINKTKSKIKDTEAEITSLKNEIKELKERIEIRNDMLKERARTFQENGGSVDYIDVLLGAASFKDFVDRVGAVATIMEADQDIIASNEADKAELEKKQTEVEDKLSGLEEMQLDLEEMQQQNIAQKEQNEAAKKDVEKQEEEYKADKAELEAKDSSLASKEAEIKQILEDRKNAELAALVEETVVNDSNESSSETSTTTSNTTTKSKSVSVNSTSTKASGNKSTAITAGYKYIGNSAYKFGGGRTASDIANGLFDCSGFVSWAYAQAGYSIPASTDGLKNIGTQVSTSEMQPGDLVFFDTYKTDGHVGIYVGGGKFIGSQSSTGVAIASMSSGYWKSKFNGRVIRL